MTPPEHPRSAMSLLTSLHLSIDLEGSSKIPVLSDPRKVQQLSKPAFLIATNLSQLFSVLSGPSHSNATNVAHTRDHLIFHFLGARDIGRFTAPTPHRRSEPHVVSHRVNMRMIADYDIRKAGWLDFLDKYIQVSSMSKLVHVFDRVG